MKADSFLIQQYVETLQTNFNFYGLYHFTDFSNFLNLFSVTLNPNQTLNSRNHCIQNNINFHDGANSEVIGHTNFVVQDCVRFYYKEKTMTLYVNEGIKKNHTNPHIPIPVYLVFSTELLILPNTWFTDGNAASQYTHFGNDYSFFSRIDWAEVLNRSPLPLDEGPDKWEKKRKRHAELLSISPIPLTYVNQIIFRTPADLKRARLLLGNDPRFVLNAQMYNNRENFLQDYSIEMVSRGQGFELHLNIKFNLPLSNDDRTKYELLDENNNILISNGIDFELGPHTDFIVIIPNIPLVPLIFRFYFYGIISIEENIRMR
ncbi:DarT ssDNA thymidine ADP-ribosyltransferase family protein [Paenibacillus tengchongensis]|uniref:DarT ssDNA thymidine ADP-ribosyltransferase family protein n=1 Tax=Paenibacillus tengchongensis TaxID=2608684 RepID=UPI001652424F|nr:DarT ssDNA thymidine ADP-ribosyltransferase family protein [Paenibacillus tengchongensis]